MAKMAKLGYAALFALGGGLCWLLASCRHKKLTRPFTNMPWYRSKSYVVCLDCAGEFDFDLKTMRMGAEITRPKSSKEGKHGV